MCKHVKNRKKYKKQNENTLFIQHHIKTTCLHQIPSTIFYGRHREREREQEKATTPMRIERLSAYKLFSNYVKETIYKRNIKKSTHIIDPNALSAQHGKVRARTHAPII